jgi:hypothetical protein
MYDEILRLHGSQSRILVILPHAYTQKLRFNSITKGRSARTVEDHVLLSSSPLSLLSFLLQRIIKKFEHHDSLYLCSSPSQEVDDLHLLYASLFDQSNRTRPTYAVTNDFMRNHAASAFPSLQVFYRWRNTQVANYEFSGYLAKKQNVSAASQSSSSSLKNIHRGVNVLLLTLPGPLLSLPVSL